LLTAPSTKERSTFPTLWLTRMPYELTKIPFRDLLKSRMKDKRVILKNDIFLHL
jgi:RNA recognition motif-containing protein